MAREKTGFEKIKKIMGKNFIGLKELNKISHYFKISNLPRSGRSIPDVPFNLNYLKKVRKDYILILGIPKDRQDQKLTINNLRLKFGYNPFKSEPCFYNQDWYLKEKFAKNTTLEFKWYLIKKTVDQNTRGKNPENIIRTLKGNEIFPSAILAAFTFFAYYLLNHGEILWKHDFIWCSDKDKNNDRIYTGRYIDPKKINKNGFNIHRHLSIRPCYGLVPQIKY
ncbi:MAG TPA: hypothetical protein VMW82_02825 [Candidatus Paceibacterota bacterium]|nr:hypothetical protein [Candidatus Paceibacterota bacterium]